MSLTANDSQWTEETLAALRRDFGDALGGRTCLVTGADGFMGSHLTEALVAIGANVHAFVRATSSGALNNIWHLRGLMKVHFADLTDRASVDYLMKELREAPDKPYVFHLGAQAHVGESWHRPYETVMTNTVGTLNLLQSIVDNEVELEPLRDFCFCTDGVRGHLTVAAHGVPGDLYVYGQGKNISMADWADLILRTGKERGYWDDREIVSTPARYRPGASDVMALRVGHEKL